MEYTIDTKEKISLHSQVLYTCNSSTIPSFPPPKTIIKSLIATALCPCRGLGAGPEVLVIRFHFNMGAAILKILG